MSPLLLLLLLLLLARCADRVVSALEADSMPARSACSANHDSIERRAAAGTGATGAPAE